MIANRLARRFFLARHGLLDPPKVKQDNAALLGLIERLGFVQLDSINTVERAHHMILFARNQTYQKEHLKRLAEDDRALFENWTHDAALIPTAFFPYWRRRFARDAARLKARWERWHGPGFDAHFDRVQEHIARHGPVQARAFRAAESGQGGGWWAWHPAKVALEYLWRTGALAVTRREGFEKVYDLTERVIPVRYREIEVDDASLVDWACRTALARLGFATPAELAAFWAIINIDQAREWCGSKAADDFARMTIEPADGGAPRPVLTDPALLESHADDFAPPPRLRVVNPFDPVIRDRARAMRLFGFDYRIEVFVPEAKRRYGYYVIPLLEGDRFVGRIDMRAVRETGDLVVENVWWEPGVKPARGRLERLAAELERIARFARCERVRFKRHPGGA